MSQTTTLGDIWYHAPCVEGWEKLIDFLDTDDPDYEVSYLTILESNGLSDAIWALAACDRELYKDYIGTRRYKGDVEAFKEVVK